jgi:hypothetical protein
MKKSLLVRVFLIVTLLGVVLVGCMPPGPKPTAVSNAVVPVHSEK